MERTKTIYEGALTEEQILNIEICRDAQVAQQRARQDFYVSKRCGNCELVQTYDPGKDEFLVKGTCPRSSCF